MAAAVVPSDLHQLVHSYLAQCGAPKAAKQFAKEVSLVCPMLFELGFFVFVGALHLMLIRKDERRKEEELERKR